MRLRGCGAAGGAAWEHVTLRGRALAAVVQLVGRWLRKRNIHVQDLMFLLDAIWVLDLIFSVLSWACVLQLADFQFFLGRSHPVSRASVPTRNGFAYSFPRMLLDLIACNHGGRKWFSSSNFRVSGCCPAQVCASGDKDQHLAVFAWKVHLLEGHICSHCFNPGWNRL